MLRCVSVPGDKTLCCVRSEDEGWFPVPNTHPEMDHCRVHVPLVLSHGCCGGGRGRASQKHTLKYWGGVTCLYETQEQGGGVRVREQYSYPTCTSAVGKTQDAVHVFPNSHISWNWDSTCLMHHSLLHGSALRGNFCVLHGIVSPKIGLCPTSYIHFQQGNPVNGLH